MHHWLQVLVASRNRVTSLPPCLHLPFLRELWLGGNRLSSVAGWPWLPSLQLLQLEDNQLAQLALMQARSCWLRCSRANPLLGSMFATNMSRLDSAVCS